MGEYPKEYFKSLENPEGHEFSCFFCRDFFETNDERISHMKMCMEEEIGEEYDEDYSFDNSDKTIASSLEKEMSRSNVVKTFISSNELESFSNRTFDEISEFIKSKNNKFDDFMIFNIYQFFFEATKEEKKSYRKKWVEWIMKDIDNY